MIIDIYTHLAPRSFLAKMNNMSPALRNITDRLLSVKALYDLEEIRTSTVSIARLRPKTSFVHAP